MRRYKLIEMVVAAGFVALWGSGALAQEFAARLSGFNETGALNNESSAILTNGTGSLSLDLDEKAGTINYTLSYSNLSSAVLQAHIHFAKVHVPGNIIVFLCTNLGNNPPGTPTPPSCPMNGGTVSGTITKASVIGVPSQNVNAGDFSAVVAAITSDTAYANVHTNNFKSGEIRGQIRRTEHDNH